MKSPALALILILALSPAAVEALGQIAGVTVTHGSMDLREGFTAFITAQGTKDGKPVDVFCQWVGGRPSFVYVREVERKELEL